MSTLHQRNWMFVFAMIAALAAIATGSWSAAVVITAAGEIKGKVFLTLADHGSRITKIEDSTNKLVPQEALLNKAVMDVYVFALKQPRPPSTAAQ